MTQAPIEAIGAEIALAGLVSSPAFMSRLTSDPARLLDGAGAWLQLCDARGCLHDAFSGDTEAANSGVPAMRRHGSLRVGPVLVK